MASKYRVIRNVRTNCPPLAPDVWFTIEKCTTPWWLLFQPRWETVTRTSVGDPLAIEFTDEAAAIGYAQHLAFYEGENSIRSYNVWQSDIDR